MTASSNKITVADSSAVRRLKAVNSSCQNDMYGLVVKNSFNVDHITECPRKLVDMALNPSKHKPSSSEIVRTAMNANVKDVWLKRFSRITGFEVIHVNYHAADNKLSLHGFVDCVLGTGDVTANTTFKHVSSNDMVSVKERGAFKKDVVSAAILSYMIHCMDSIVVYSHGNDTAIFHFRRDNSIVEAVKKKCSEMTMCVLNGSLPDRCRDKRCVFCHPVQEEAQ